jgi:hypothetical protein
LIDPWYSPGFTFRAKESWRPGCSEEGSSAFLPFGPTGPAKAEKFKRMGIDFETTLAKNDSFKSGDLTEGQ